jgi:NADH:ubiquinone oxidoreductase subunit C
MARITRQTTIDIKRNIIIDLLQFLKESQETAYNFLANLTAVDYLEYESKNHYELF